MSDLSFEDRMSWDEHYMRMAHHWAQRSRDPSTKVGAVLMRPNHTQASQGYNDFPRGIAHLPERYLNRDFKYLITVHAEQNALNNALEDVTGYTIYCTFAPCARCAANIINRGIACVVVEEKLIPERWRPEMELAADVLREAQVELRYMVPLDLEA